MDERAKRHGRGRAVGAVLAGGWGSRIGGEKAIAELAGRPLIAYPLAAVEAAGLRPLVVAKPDSQLPPLDCEVIREGEEPRHPLCGILAALQAAGAKPLVVLGCDMPFVPAELLAWLAGRAEPLVAARLGGRIQPFPARYGQALAEPLHRALAEERPMNATLEALGPRLLGAAELAAFGEPERICFNVNSAADLDRATALLEPAPGP